MINRIKSRIVRVDTKNVECRKIDCEYHVFYKNISAKPPVYISACNGCSGTIIDTWPENERDFHSGIPKWCPKGKK